LVALRGFEPRFDGWEPSVL